METAATFGRVGGQTSQRAPHVDEAVGLRDGIGHAAATFGSGQIEAVGGALPWYLEKKNPIHPLEKIAYSEQRTRMTKLADLGFSGQDLQRISHQQSHFIRKTILEKVRGRGGMGGYVVTGLRDTPLATSSMFDDLGRMKYEPDDFRAFNAETVLILEQGRRRVWQRGGDRPAAVDRFNLRAGAPDDYRVVLAHEGAPLADGDLHWWLTDRHGTIHASGSSAASASRVNGTPREIAAIAFTTPQQPGEYRLAVELGDARNAWTLWVYPPPGDALPALAWHDPGGCLSEMTSLRALALPMSDAMRFDLLEKRVLVTSAPDAALLDFVRGGGRALIIQQGEGMLPVLPRPFWRESIRLIYPHPLWDGFPHRGYTDSQFYSLATDYAFDHERLAAFPGVTAITPILRRLDARLFTLAEYLVELRIGAGVALASTLRFAGGAGDQVQGLEANVAGRHLLEQALRYLGGSA
jgi:hypothetical protein